MSEDPVHEQLYLFDLPPLKKKASDELKKYTDKQVNERDVINFIINILEKRQKPSAFELLKIIEAELGITALMRLNSALHNIAFSKGNEFNLISADRKYCQALIEDGSLEKASKVNIVPKNEIISTIDDLLTQCKTYRNSKAFQEMIHFMGTFREYAPYNNMLVRLQNPTCSFYATYVDWKKKFNRKLKEDARPMIILAPMHPVMLVYDLDQTVGDALPEELTTFSKFSGCWNPTLLIKLIKNANKYLIRIDFKELSSTSSGFATIARGTGDWKMRIAVHNGLDEPSRYGVLCHELAHIFLGHLGSDIDYWWPARLNLAHSTVEIEAESVAYIVTNRQQLSGSSSTYISRHLKNKNEIPKSVSLDLIAKVAKKLEVMSSQNIQQPKSRQPVSG